MKFAKNFTKGMGVLFFFVLLGASLLLFKAQFSLSNIQVPDSDFEEEDPSLFDELPEDDPLLKNILFLGIRGEESPYGGLLTDSLLLVSLNESSKKISLISIPRDLYVRLPGEERKEKINFVYAFGLEKSGVGKGIDYAERVVSRVTGLHIDETVVVELDALKKVIKTLGGVELYLEEPFVEDKQWFCDAEGEDCWRFELPAGRNHLNATQTLYYIRSRFSSSDFDRARRQQQVLLAVKEKLFNLGVLTRPDRILSLIDIVDNNVRTSMSQSEMIGLVRRFNSEHWDLNDIKRMVIRAGEDHLLKEATLEGGRYILLPRKSDWSGIKAQVERFVN